MVENPGFTAAYHQDATQIVAVISQCVEGKINESIERYHFRQHCQQPGESLDDFLVRSLSWLRLVASAPENVLSYLFGTKLLKVFWKVMP